MVRLINVYVQKPYKLICKFNNGAERVLDVLPLIEQHKYIDGVSVLLNDQVFASVEVGEFGEITWRDIVKKINNGNVEFWDYDISPEFAFSHSHTIK